MVLTGRERQERYRRRAAMAKGALPGILDAMEEIVAITERAIAQERLRGTVPNDGTAAGKLLAEQEAWVAYNRRQLKNAKEQAGSTYDLKPPR
jgi:hypothetical protein